MAINCACLNHSLAESQLLGHEAGAFTGADDPRRGSIGLRGGRVIQAEVGDESGLDALIIMSEWGDCDLNWSDETPDVVNIKETLEDLSNIDGFIAAAVVDSDSGMSPGTLGGTNELEDAIEDILITLDGQYHLIRPLEERPNIFFYMALNRDKSNLAMARMSVADAGNGIEL